MSDVDQTTTPDEFELLTERARMLGINPGNSSLESLRKKVADKMAGAPEETAEAEVDTSGMSKRQFEQHMREKLQKERMALVRCRIYNLNPSKRDLRGEIITVANRYIGTVRKFIPFGEATDGGYHIPKVIYDDLKSRKFQDIRTKNVQGRIEVSSRDVPEYSIEILPPLTAEELHELAVHQAAADRLGA